MSVQLRDYQVEAVEAIEREHGEKGLRSTLIVLATGLGKTTIFCEWARRRHARHGGRVLVIAHREELVNQAAERLRKQIPDVEVGIEMAGQHTSSLMPQPFVVASVQSLSMAKRLKRFQPWDFTSVVVDEAHHATSGSYRTILDHFHAAQVLGVTATPDRRDKVGLGHLFDSCAYRMDIYDGIDRGFLSPIVAKQVVVEHLDISRVRSRAGDLTAADLEQAMNNDRVLHEIAGPLVQEAGPRSTIVFTPTVATAKQLVNVLAGYTKSRAAVVHGETESDTRKGVLAEYERGDIQFLVNCAVLTEGFDSPRTSCVALARPTGSRALMTQCIGRGTRLFPGKENLLVIDFVGMVGTSHHLCTPEEVLMGENPLPEIWQDRMRELSEQGMSLDRAYAQAERESKEAERVAREMERLRQEEDARRRNAKVYADARYAAQRVDPFGNSFGKALVIPENDGGSPMSDKQRALLSKFGITSAALSSKQAQQVIGAQFKRIEKNLCTLKQARVLVRYGYDTSSITLSQASKLLDAIASNGWARGNGPRFDQP
jgi:superfamily II DNA or RNA helicase